MNKTTTVVTRKNLVHSARDNTDDDHQFNTVSLELHISKSHTIISNKILNLSQFINRFVFKVLTERIKRSVRSVVAAVAA